MSKASRDGNGGVMDSRLSPEIVTPRRSRRCSSKSGNSPPSDSSLASSTCSTRRSRSGTGSVRRSRRSATIPIARAATIQNGRRTKSVGPLGFVRDAQQVASARASGLGIGNSDPVSSGEEAIAREQDLDGFRELTRRDRRFHPVDGNSHPFRETAPPQAQRPGPIAVRDDRFGEPRYSYPVRAVDVTAEGRGPLAHEVFKVVQVLLPQRYVPLGEELGNLRRHVVVHHRS